MSHPFAFAPFEKPFKRGYGVGWQVRLPSGSCKEAQAFTGARDVADCLELA